jgi:hypothetical protein
MSSTMSRMEAAGRETGTARNARCSCLGARLRACNADTKSATTGPAQRANRWSSPVNPHASSAGLLEEMIAEAEEEVEEMVGTVGVAVAEGVQA